MIEHIKLEVHSDKRGKLLSIEQTDTGLPFSPKRSFYLYDVPAGSTRAGHAVNCDQFLIALRGSVHVELQAVDGAKKSWELSKINEGLFVPAMNHITLKGFSDDALIVIYASKAYADTKYFSLEDLKKE